MDPKKRIWLPPEVHAPGFICRICSTPFHDGEQLVFEQHVERCFSRNEQEVLEEAPSRKMPAFFSEVDPEWGEYCRDLARRGIDPEMQYERRSKRSPKRSLLEN